MTTAVLWVLGYLGIGVGFVGLLLLLDSLLEGLANRFADRSADGRHRLGTQLPRALK
jgi:hypothetical protein